ncbi:uncharacterized protein PHACADRAFT_249009 [Phanerochaete carnosa HHB-10118-sp]|uniref:Uncharacterized protein n=1 Tax=Phanerochaete carnosa (strain HHB-10118-sp) TaxID=650164 RepID=K5X7S7_PHACS|nr:uncharacterized protein PHACADRAFT_249009 [Phanerochaete carnosa HHB-10118-sp]EKM58897.1 hypothetical protein PHACADRAFT_249009 [Phanerochaete carnosa HHB-10118-sp]
MCHTVATLLVAPLVVAAPIIIAAATIAYEKCNIVLSALHTFKLLSNDPHVSRAVLTISKVQGASQLYNYLRYTGRPYPVAQGSLQPFSSCGQRCARRPVESDMGGNDAGRSAVFSSV